MNSTSVKLLSRAAGLQIWSEIQTKNGCHRAAHINWCKAQALRCEADRIQTNYEKEIARGATGQPQHSQGRSSSGFGDYASAQGCAR